METVGKLAPLGFGFMRLPLKDADDPTSIDIDKVCELVDIFMDAGFTYFDSARGYHGCKSEWALRKALVERYPRDSFTIATKLPAWLAKDADEARAMFDTSLEECGIDYFDYYLLHNLGETLTPPFDEYGLWEFCAEKKAEEAADAHKTALDFVKEQSRDFFEPIERELSENSEPVTHRHLLDFIKRGDLEGYKHAIVEHFRLYTIYLERHKR